MTETITELVLRKSVRAFEDRRIEPEKKALILKAAAEAPTAGNQQLYTIIDVTSQEIKERLVKSCDNQPFIAKAELVLVFCADPLKWYDAFKAEGCQPRELGVGDLMLAVSDANIAAQNAVTAAWSLGIGSCYIGDITENCELQREILSLPEYVFPAAMLVFGYPTEQQISHEKPPRCDMRHIVHENSYRRMDSAELREMLTKNIKSGTYEEWINAFCKRKYNSDFSVEMTRSVEAYLADYGLTKK